MLVEVTLLRFRSALGKWAPDSIAETTLFNVTTVPWKFSIICYVVPSMFMTANPSSSKLYVNLYVSFMTHGSQEMSGNVISMFPGARARVMDTTLRRKITVFNTCLQSRVQIPFVLIRRQCFCAPVWGGRRTAPSRDLHAKLHILLP